MANIYKGLTVQIGGDTTTLQASLREARSAASQAGRAIGQINKALKINPTNVELINSKFTETTLRVNATRQSLDRLTQGYNQLASKSNLTDSEANAMRRLGVQIESTKQQLSTYEERQEAAGKAAQAAGYEIDVATGAVTKSQSAAGKVSGSLFDMAGKFQNASDKTKSFSSSAKSAGDAMSHSGTVITGAAGAAAGAAVKGFTEVDSGLKNAIKLTGATGDAADDLKNVVKQTATSAPGDFATVGTAVGEVATRFQETGDACKDTSTKFLQFSKNTGVDVKSAIDQTAMSMKAFGVDSSKSGEVLGLFQSVSQQTGIDVNTLMQDVNQNGATFREMGLSIQDSAQMLGGFESAGIPVQTMLPGLKRAMSECQKSGKDMGSTLQDLSKRLQDPAQQAQATQDAFSLFGIKAGGAFVEAAESGRLNLGKMGGSLDQYGNKVSETFNGTVTPIDKAKASLKKLEEIGADIAQSLVPELQRIADAAAQMKAKWDSLSPSQQKFASDAIKAGLVLGTLSLAVGKTLTAIGKISGALKAASNGFMVAAKGVQGFGKVLKILRLTTVPGILLSIVAALVVFFTQTETGRGIIKKLGEVMNNIGQAVIPALKNAFNTIAPAVQTAVSIAGAVFKTLGTIIGGVVQFIISILAPIARVIASVFRAGVELASAVFQTLVSVVQIVFSLLVAIFAPIANAIGDFFSPIVGLVSNVFDGVVNFVSGIPGAIVGFFNGIGQAISGLFDLLGITDAFNNIVNFVSGIPDQIVGFFTGIGDRIASFFENIHIPSLHVSGGFNLDPNNFQVPSIEWYAKGGVFAANRPTVIGVGDAAEPEYVGTEKTLVQKYGIGVDENKIADAVARSIRGMGIYVDGRALIGAVADGASSTMRMVGGAR